MICSVASHIQAFYAQSRADGVASWQHCDEMSLTQSSDSPYLPSSYVPVSLFFYPRTQFDVTFFWPLVKHHFILSPSCLKLPQRENVLETSRLEGFYLLLNYLGSASRTFKQLTPENRLFVALKGQYKV